MMVRRNTIWHRRFSHLALSGPLLAAQQPPVTDSGNLPPKDNVRPKSRARLHGEFPCAISLDRSLQAMRGPRRNQSFAGQLANW
jgi:hypothetical protein